MFQFHGKSPSKQGTKYSLNLGQNDGPFLMKDMTLSNPKTLHYLKSNQLALSTAQSILSGSNQLSVSDPRKTSPRAMPKSFASPKQKIYDNVDEGKKTNLSASANVNSSMFFQKGLMGDSHQLLDSYKKEIGEYRDGLKQMQVKISGQPFDELRALQMQMRKFYSVMRDHSDAVQNDNYQLQRDIDQLNRDKHNLIQQLGFYARRLEELEKTIGAAAKLEDSNVDGSDDEDD